MLKNRSKLASKSIEIGFKIDYKVIPALDDQKGARNSKKVVHFAPQNGRKINQIAVQNRLESNTKSNIETEAVSSVILKRFWIDFGGPAKAKILQNLVRGVKNHTLRIYNIER